MMKSIRRKRVAAGIMAALLLQCGTGYMVAQGAEIQFVNKNDGTEDQPMIASEQINVNDNSVINDDKTYFGVYSTGQSTQTTIGLTGAQSISLSGDVNTTYKAYGIYNEKGATTGWQLNDTGEGLTTISNAYVADAYGIYNTGAQSTVTVLPGEGSGLNISASGYGIADDSSGTLPQYPPAVNVAGVWGDAGAVNTVSAQTIQATAQANNYKFGDNSQQMYDQNVLTQLNAAIVSAADAYAAVIDKYGTYEDEQSYLEDLNKAQAAVDTAIAAYKAIAGGTSAIGIYGDTEAENTIDIAEQLSVNDTLSVEQTLTADSSENALVMKSEAIGVSGNNGAQNVITVTNGINVSASSNIYTTISGGTTGGNLVRNAVYTFDAIGVYGANASKNSVTTSSDINVYGYGNISRNLDLSGSTVFNLDNVEASTVYLSGVYGESGAQSLVQAGNITALLQNWTDSSYLQGMLTDDKGADSKYVSSVSVTGIEANDSASNEVIAAAIYAGTQSVYVQDSIYLYSGELDGAATGDVSAVRVLDVNVRGISGDNGTNQITADSISAQLQNFSSSISDNISASNNSNDLTMSATHTLYVPVEVRGYMEIMTR